MEKRSRKGGENMAEYGTKVVTVIDEKGNVDIVARAYDSKGVLIHEQSVAQKKVTKKTEKD